LPVGLAAVAAGLVALPPAAATSAPDRRLQIQEFLVRDIAQTIEERIQAKGVFVRSRAVHLCVHSRGPSDHTMETVCTSAVGSFEAIARQAQLCHLLAVQSR
jgi:GTP cyclohydrolase I